LALAKVPHYREGFNLYLTDQNLYIAHGCSGIRYLLSYLVFGTAYAFRFKHSVRARLAVVISAIPLAVIGGIVRLAVIFFTTHYISPIFVSGRPHILMSWAVFTTFLILAITSDQIVTKKKA
jgi:exosortase